MLFIISSINSWAQGIIVAVIIATIIEMLLPNNGNGKYVKTIVGLFVLFSIISPILSRFKDEKDFSNPNFEKYIKNNVTGTVQTSSSSINTEDTIKKMFEENLKVDIKSKVSQKGYVADNINLEIINDKEYTLNKIEFKVIARNETNSQASNNYTTTIVDNIENIKVSLGGSRKDEKKEEKSILNDSEKRKLKEYLSGVYEVKENNIIIY